MRRKNDAIEIIKSAIGDDEEETEKELEERQKANQPIKWITDEYGSQGFILFHENKYWLTRYNRATGSCTTFFLTQEQYDERISNLKQVRISSIDKDKESQSGRESRRKTKKNSRQRNVKKSQRN